jgi:hypothetical protein
LVRRRRKEEYGGYVLEPQEEDRLDWEVRSFVYARLVEHGLPPTAEQTSAGLGIPAALHSDAEVEAEYAEDGSPARLSVESGELQGDAGLVHFPLPLRRWYEDLVFT